MTYQDEVLQQLKAQTALMQVIAHQLKINAPASPKYRRSLKDYHTFNWTTIGAEVIAKDGQGVSEVEWMSHRFTRRSAGPSKFGKAIWFSRAIGQSEDGTEYALLIKFGDAGEAEPIPAGVLGK